GTRGSARRRLGADDRANAVPAADDDAGDPALRVRGRSARRPRKSRRCRHRRSLDRRVPQSHRPVRRVRHAGAAFADRIRSAAARAPREAERALRAKAGAARMKLVPIGVVVAVLVALPFLISGYHQGLATYVAIYFIAILGLNILTGY